MLSAGDLIDRTWEYYRARLGALAQFVIAVLAVTVLGDSLAARANRLPGTIFDAPAGIAVAAIMTFADLYLTVALVRFVRAELSGTPANPRTAASGAARVYGQALVVFIVVTLLEALGLLLLIIPGILVSVALSFAIIIASLDRIRPLEALHESWKIVQPRFRAIAWRLLLPIFFWQLAAFVIGSLVAYIAHALRAPDFIATLLFDIVQASALPLPIVSVVLLYLDATKIPKTTT